MAQGVYSWSKTASSNDSADASVNWREGQSPSSINDSARAMMARVAEWRDDTSGSIIATGSSTAYVIASNTVFPSFTAARLSQFSFLAPATNGAGVTLNLDGTGAQPINGVDGVPVPAGTLIASGAYTVTAFTGEWILHSFFGQPNSIPIGGMTDFIGSTVPNSSFVFPTGQAISRVTYATLFALIGTTYGIGDGSTTFNVPDLTGRIVAMKEASATRLTSTYFGGNSTNLGAVGGLESQLLTASQIPSITSANGSQSISVTTTQKVVNGINQGSSVGGGTQVSASDPGSGGALSLVSSSGSNSISVTSNNTGGNSHANVQPTIILNKILRII